MVEKLRPFFTYFGGKWRASPKYPKPKWINIVEPFAGSAGYSVRYPNRRVTLYDENPVVAELWNYLIRVKVTEILHLPTQVQHTDELTCCQEAKWLIGFWLNKGMTAPCRIPSKWMREYGQIQLNTYWGEGVRARIAHQVKFIRHWRACNSSYLACPNLKASWFIDPPYQHNPEAYPHHDIDYTQLGRWCKARKGQTIVCERQGADWLPFQVFGSFKGLEGKHGCKVSKEVVWQQ